LKTDIHNNLIEFGSHEIEDWCVLDAIGDSNKVEEFLQGQLTSDISSLTNGSSQLSSICNHKGQVIADLIAYKHEEKFKIIIDKGLMEVFIDELTPFAKFFSTKFDLSNERVIGRVSKKNSSESFYATNSTFQVTIELNKEDLKHKSTIGYDKWDLANKLLGIFFLKKEDSGKYRPLEINYDKLRVSFEKGCYRGQEIVARMKYLGVDRRKFCTFITSNDFKEINDIKILGNIVIIDDKKIFNGIIKKDQLKEMNQIPGIIDIY